MSRLISAAERITKSRALIQKARDFPPPADGGWSDFSYVAQVKDLLRQSRDLIKFLSYSPGTAAEMKKEIAGIFAEIEQLEKELLRK